MEIVLNTFGVSLNRDNEAFVITSKNGRQRMYQLEQVADKRTSDVTRACFLSVDHDAYFNGDCEPVDMGLYITHSKNTLFF